MSQQYSNPFAVKLPLLRVAHPSGEDNKLELDKVRTTLGEKSKKNLLNESLDAEDSLQRDASTKGVPGKKTGTAHQQAHNPLLFNFEHYYDPELTPRKNWQTKVVNLDSLLEQEKEKFTQLKQENAETKADLEKQILALSSKLKESESENFQLKERLTQEERLKEEYHRSFKRAQFDLEKI